MIQSRSRFWKYSGCFLLLIAAGALGVFYLSILFGALANEGSFLLLKVAIAAGLAGVAILFVVVIRDRLLESKSNRYDDVEA